MVPFSLINAKWRTPELNHLSGDNQSYGFEYDGLNRLTTANYGQAGLRNTDYDASMSEYDLNGNIKQLIRRKKGEGESDALTYTYIRNKLESISDAATGIKSLGFKDGSSSGVEYNYDLNGNMKED